jgi:hypothetical protein
MNANFSTPSIAGLLCSESIARRKLPVNFNQDDLGFFNHELEKVIPETKLLQFNNVGVSSDGLLFNGWRILPESFAFSANMQEWKRRSVLKFFFNNRVLRRWRSIDYDVLWITDDWSNGYFHWLTDVLTRLYVMRERLDELVLLLPGSYQSLDFIHASLKAFGVKAVEFIGKNEALRCRRLFLPTHTAPSGHYNEEIIRGVRGLLLQALGEVGGAEAEAGERIYISRGRSRKRKIGNEEEVIQLLGEYGFQTLYAEDLSFEQQVKIFSRSRYLISNHGAGLTNMLFMPRGSSVLELRHHTDAINNCYFTLSSALELNYFYQKCQADNSHQDPHLANLVVDLARMKVNLDLLVSS